MLSTALRALARTWPTLLAWYLAGWIARFALLRLAGQLGNIDALYGMLVLPLAVLARLVGYVGMFLAVRSALPHFTELDRRADAAGPRRSPLRRWTDSLLGAILPFFLLYVAWGLMQDDITAYASSSLDQLDFSQESSGNALAVSFGAISVAVLLVALIGRWLLGWFRSRLPAWTTGVATYLEALWVLLFAFFVLDLLADVPEWLASRAMFAPLVDAWAAVRDALPWLAAVADTGGWLFLQASDLVLRPLAWLAFAAIVLLGTLPALRLRVGGRTGRMTARAAERWAGLPGWQRRVLRWATAGLAERWQPVAQAAQLVARIGPLGLGGYLLGFAVLEAAAGWVRTGVYRLMGPHELAWWLAVDETVALGVDAVLAVLQICLVAATFDLCLRRLDEAREAEGATPLLAAPAAADAGRPAARDAEHDGTGDGAGDLTPGAGVTDRPT